MQHDLAIVICTVCRESLLRAISSIYAQAYDGRIQILVGVDVDSFGHESELHDAIMQECPEHIQINWINLGYSTSKRHGGIHSCYFGGSLRTSLSFLANSRYVMYLDDDDWLAPDHCTQIMHAIQGKKWAFAYSIYSDSNTSRGICVDALESLGVDQGIYSERFGGFVRPSGLMVDKMQVSQILHLWSSSPFPTGDGEDRLIFDQLRNMDHSCTGNATVYYSLDPKDSAHITRMQFIKSRGLDINLASKDGSVR